MIPANEVTRQEINAAMRCEQGARIVGFIELGKGGLL